MGVLQCARHLGHQRNYATRLPAQCGGRFEQTAAASKLHAEEGQPLFALAHLINGQNVRVIELGRSLSFAPKAHQRLLRIDVAR